MTVEQIVSTGDKRGAGRQSVWPGESVKNLPCTVPALWVLKEQWDFLFGAYLDFLNKIFYFFNLVFIGPTLFF